MFVHCSWWGKTALEMLLFRSKLWMLAFPASSKFLNVTQNVNWMPRLLQLSLFGYTGEESENSHLQLSCKNARTKNLMLGICEMGTYTIFWYSKWSWTSPTCMAHALCDTYYITCACCSLCIALAISSSAFLRLLFRCFFKLCMLQFPARATISPT